jgi:hypothetical protein
MSRHFEKYQAFEAIKGSGYDVVTGTEDEKVFDDLNKMRRILRKLYIELKPAKT